MDYTPSLHIAEFNQTAKGGTAVLCPPVVTQILPITQEGDASEVFHHQTVIIRVKADVDCWVGFGNNREDTKANIPLIAGVEHFGVLPGYYLVVIAA